jgi:hypothetical protein
VRFDFVMEPDDRLEEGECHASPCHHAPL